MENSASVHSLSFFISSKPTKPQKVSFKKIGRATDDCTPMSFQDGEQLLVLFYGFVAEKRLVLLQRFYDGVYFIEIGQICWWIIHLDRVSSSFHSWISFVVQVWLTASNWFWKR